jgi:hypothetical protein
MLAPLRGFHGRCPTVRKPNQQPRHRRLRRSPWRAPHDRYIDVVAVCRRACSASLSRANAGVPLRRAPPGQRTPGVPAAAASTPVPDRAPRRRRLAARPAGPARTSARDRRARNALRAGPGGPRRRIRRAADAPKRVLVQVSGRQLDLVGHDRTRPDRPAPVRGALTSGKAPRFCDAAGTARELR